MCREATTPSTTTVQASGTQYVIAYRRQGPGAFTSYYQGYKGYAQDKQWQADTRDIASATKYSRARDAKRRMRTGKFPILNGLTFEVIPVSSAV